MDLPRHFTATGYLVSGDALLLHWHAKVQAWLPPGGHVEPNEDPVQAVLREVLEETGIAAEVVAASPVLDIPGRRSSSRRSPSWSRRSTTPWAATTSTSI